MTSPLRSSVRRLLRAAALVSLAACGRSTADEPQKGSARSSSGPATSSPAPSGTPSTAGWNTAQIDWQSYDTGMRLAKEQNKPVCLVFSTTWCPHCKNYSHVFEDARVVTHARDFVMIHLDADHDETLNAKYAPDGTYIPRTFFLGPDGTLDSSIHAPRGRSIYFYDERDPSALLAAMDTAHKKLVN
jgi:thiol-disulfide isomerase/thioredoxin